ncbi:MAG: phage baseplate assembly protein V, partial [Desulfovibrio sp.]|nr:phage baseplate assembly protein V [Desulfovibrio sp.]
LPVLCPRACEDMQYDLPDIGDQVLCLFLPYGLEQGFVIGAMYGKKAPPVQSGDKWHRVFKDGTTLEYDRAEHKLTANVQGDVELVATGNVTMQAQGPISASSQDSITAQAPRVQISGTSGNMEMQSGDVRASSISLVHHVHTCPACGADTSPPH